MPAQFVNGWSNDPAINLLASTQNSTDVLLVGPHYHPTSGGKPATEDSWMAFYSYNQITQNYDMRVQYIDYNGSLFLETRVLL